MAETYKYGLTDIDGHPVPDSTLSPTGRDLFDSTGDYKTDLEKGVGAYIKGQRVLLSSIDLDKYIVKFIAGLWRVREKPTISYKIVEVYNKRFVLGDKIDVTERDDFKFEYYMAAMEKYDMFGVLTPDFNMYIAKCNTIRGPMSRYGETRADARAFLRGAIMDTFGPEFALIVFGDNTR